jgi:hypothetical protein
LPGAAKYRAKCRETVMRWDWIGESLLRFYDRITSPRGWRDSLATATGNPFGEKTESSVEADDLRATTRRSDDFEHRGDFSQHIGC